MKKLVCACGCGSTVTIPDGQQLKDVIAALGWFSLSEVYEGKASRAGHLRLQEPQYFAGIDCLYLWIGRARTEENKVRLILEDGLPVVTPTYLAGLPGTYV